MTNNGTFSHNSGTVTLDTTGTSVLDGSGSPAITFYNLTAATGGKSLQFTAAKTFQINHFLTLRGASGNNLSVNSTTGSQWFIKHLGEEDVNNLTLANSGCDVSSNAISVEPVYTNNGNNGTCWAQVIGKRIKGNAAIRGNVRIK
jgi:hypothetical protein